MWLRLETDPSFNFDFFLAEKLRMSLGQVRQMAYADWLAWSVYFGREAQRRELANR